MTRADFEQVAAAVRVLLADHPNPAPMVDRFVGQIGRHLRSQNPQFVTSSFRAACNPRDDSYSWRSIRKPEIATPVDQ